MVFPMIGAALSAFAGSSLAAPALTLAGTVLGANAQRRENEAARAHSDPQAVRDRYEAAGFNPLLGIMNGSAQPTYPNQSMGSIISNGLAVVGDQFQEHRRLEAQIAQQQVENERLERQLQNQILRPKVPGIYSNERRNAFGQNNIGVHAGSDFVSGSGVAGVSGSGASIEERPPSLPEKNEKALFTLGGINFVGSGQYSTGGQFEEAVGENPLLSWPYAMAVFGDAVGSTYVDYMWKNSPKWRQRQIDKAKRKISPQLSTSSYPAYTAPMTGGHYQPFYTDN